MDLFAEVKGRVLAAVERLASEGRLPGGSTFRRDGRAAARPRPRRHGDQCRDGAGAAGADGAARDRRGAGRGARRATGIVAAEVAGPGFLNLRLEPARWFGVVPAVLAAGTGFGRSTLGAGAQGQRRVRLGQPDGADARRAYARRGVRRRAGRPARLRRVGGDAGILYQRRRGAGRRAGAVGL